jgi:hypothetical protein
MRKKVFIAIGVMVVLVLLVIPYPVGPSRADMVEMLGRDLPIGTPKERVLQYASQKKMEHSEYLPKERLVNAMVRGIKKGFLFESSLHIQFRFDEAGRLASVSVDEVGTAL